MGVRLQGQAADYYQYPLLIKQLLNTPLLSARRQEIVYRDKIRYHYGDLPDRLGRLATMLHKIGVTQGTTVAVMDWDSHRYLECYFAVPMMGAVLMTVNVRLAADQILYTLDHAKAEVLIVHRDFVDLVGELLPRLPQIKALVYIDDYTGNEAPPGYVGDFEALLDESSADYRFPEFSENAVATSFYTSGTTGLPKAVSFTHRQIVLHTMAIVGLYASQAPEGFKHGDVYMPITPMFHVHAWGIPYAATLLGLKQVYPGRYLPQELIALRAREHVTFSHCVPTVLQMLLTANETMSADLTNWTIVIGGSALPQSLCAAARRHGIRPVAGYGMSETGPILALTRSEPDGTASEEEQVAMLCRTGKPAPLVDLRIVDEEMRDVPHDGVSQGEIVARAPWLTAAYVGDETASAALWRGGWLHTQDVATIDRDGVVQIRDRLKDVIKTGGEWVSSLLLEDLLLSHRDIAEVAVVGVPDMHWGERPVAFVVLAGGEIESSNSLEDMRRHLQPAVQAGTISRYAVPDRVIAVDALPRTSVGKIDKKQLRALIG